MRSNLGAWLAVLMLGVGVDATAEIGTMDIVPSATLLLPYFEADAEVGESSPLVDTRFVVRNTSSAPAIAHMVFYTDFGVPTFAHTISLVGHDVERFSVHEIIATNSLGLAEESPVEGTPVPGPTEVALFSDGFETGDLSNWSIIQSDISIESVRAYHSGQMASREGNSAGFDYGDEIARGYVTIDSVNEITTALPSAAGYFIDGGVGIANNENILTGEYETIDSPNNFSDGNPLVHIEADDTGDTGTPGEYTFYSRYTAATAADNREPLATRYAARFVDGGAFDGGTSLSYWRDIKIDQGPLMSGSSPAWYPLSVNIINVYDENGTVAGPTSFSEPFPLACGRVQVNGPSLTTPFDFGLLEMDFNIVFQGEFSSINQVVVYSRTGIAGRLAIGNRALPLDNALDLTP